MKVLTILGNLRLPWARFQQEARSFGTSKVAYGWISRCATQRDCWKVWATVRRGQHCLFRANRYLRAIVLGGNSHLDSLVGVNLFRIVARMFSRNAREWHNRPGTPLRALRDCLRTEAGLSGRLGLGGGLLLTVTWLCLRLRALSPGCCTQSGMDGDIISGATFCTREA